MRAFVGTIVCTFGGDPVISVVEVAICAEKFTDGQTDGRTDRRTDNTTQYNTIICNAHKVEYRTPRDCISSWNELIIRQIKCIS